MKKLFIHPCKQHACKQTKNNPYITRRGRLRQQWAGTLEHLRNFRGYHGRSYTQYPPVPLIMDELVLVT